MSVTFRLATVADQPRIVEIYNQAIATKGSTADLDLTTVAQRQGWFAEFSADHFPLWVMELNDQVVGYVGLEPYSDRVAYAQTAEIALYLATEAQGHHLGGQAIQWAESAGKQLGLHTIISRIFGHNQASRHLFEKNGFEHWGHLPAIADMRGFSADLEVYGKHF
ncbi:MAG: GNAT family N-acetyltransferase [Levilactobacillus sp.]|jgi:phosphinothricin acetyltransferase|uniref:GNAT family N-acetyltransferase n=1 Tax=Levilactobacillus sp. TaxID=2767919 RepID=UPI002586E8C2|nr:GNAT family N-acetyltransferase [Levilactobacillus sp.]MCI1553043.1 GNAT family N-acetyltransferase [Levilactobacillus sp.]MCI1598184.1 GNAT family N-acetyltransferase [Levilactobacillus sp.]MCI1605047.1 GNAT family N-acetyltransferase [Levilactobacillus sp.]